ncbi:MAG: hypothetical protein H0U87_06135, partial [Acidobacteria bacterium]|nr:hypothetical protein [Acidobacteriota bacterium]
MKENDTDNKIRQSPKPNPDLKSFEKLIGTWKVSGGLQGTNTFEWTENGF